MKGSIRNIFTACLAAVTALAMTACGGIEPDSNLIVEEEKTYDDVALDRVRNSMDDLYLLNPDTIQTLG